MARFTLVILEGGRVILTSKEDFTRETSEALQHAFMEWRIGPIERPLMIPDCEVIDVHDSMLTIDLRRQVEREDPERVR